MIAISRTGRLLRRLVRLSCRRPPSRWRLSLAPRRPRHRATPSTRCASRPPGATLLPQDAGYVRRTWSTRASSASSRTSWSSSRRAPSRRPRPTRRGSSQELRAGAGQVPPRVAYRIDPKRFEGRQLLYLSHREAARDPRQDLRPPGVHGELRGATRAWPGSSRASTPSSRQRFVSNLFDIGLQDKDRPIDTRFLQRAPRPDRPAPRPAHALPLALGHAVLLRARTPEPTPATSSPRTRACSSSWSRPPKGEKGSFMGDQAAIEADPRRGGRAARGLPATCRPGSPARPPCPTTR